MSESDVNDARSVERAYRSPEIGHQRFQTLKALNIRPGERILDAGCGPGLLAEELARLTGSDGQVVAVDKSRNMLALAKERCRELPWVEFKEGSIERLDQADGSFDAAVITQVLLYVRDVPGVLKELHRVLATGGRLALVETDWRSCVLNSDDFELTETMIKAWNDGVPSPNLPVHLTSMLRSCGFKAIHVEPIPVLNTSLLPDGYSGDMMKWFARKAVEQGKASEGQARGWLDDLQQKARDGDYFFCVNRFLFTAIK